MSGDVAAGALRAGHQDLQAGRWVAAREAFEAALRDDECAEALLGLGQALSWLGDTRAAVRCHQRVRRLSARQGSGASCADRGLPVPGLPASLGNHPASQGWLGLAENLVADTRPAGLIGWVLFCRAVVANDSGDPVDAERWAREALTHARDVGDVDLELSAVSELGAALVELGRTYQGMALLDEAMAGALAGEAASLDTVVLTCCTTIRSCSRGGDFRRAAQWVSLADDFHERYGSPHLNTTCRTQLGAVLVATGAWDEAERELRSALEIGRSAERAVYAEALGVLGELRLAQGRLDEAARLLEGFEDEPATACAVAAVRLALGENAVAVRGSPPAPRPRPELLEGRHSERAAGPGPRRPRGAAGDCRLRRAPRRDGRRDTLRADPGHPSARRAGRCSLRATDPPPPSIWRDRSSRRDGSARPTSSRPPASCCPRRSPTSTGRRRSPRHGQRSQASSDWGAERDADEAAGCCGRTAPCLPAADSQASVC